MNYFKDYHVFIVAFGVSIPIIIFTRFSFFGLCLEKNISIGLLAMVGGLTALGKYSYEKKRDLRLASIETVSFFREKLMEKNNDYIVELGAHSPDEYAVPLHSNDISILMKHFENQIYNQMETFGNNLSTTRKLKYDILNLAEEFALKVKFNSLTENEILFPLRKAYIDIIESHSCLILLVRDLQYGINAYNNAEELYINWSERIKKTPITDSKKEAWKQISKDLINI